MDKKQAFVAVIITGFIVANLVLLIFFIKKLSRV